MGKTKDMMYEVRQLCPKCGGKVMGNYKSNPALGKCLGCSQMVGLTWQGRQPVNSGNKI
jgi:ribosomal protein S27AE